MERKEEEGARRKDRKVCNRGARKEGMVRRRGKRWRGPRREGKKVYRRGVGIERGEGR